MCVYRTLAILLTALGTIAAHQNMDYKTLPSSIARFSAKFCNQLPKDKSVVSSPLSAEFLLALLTLGTTDPAHSELLTSLGIDNDNDIRTAFSSVSSKLKSIKGVTLNVANKVYIQEGPYKLQAQLQKDAVNIFDTAMEKVDFGKSASTVKAINDWVESKTNNKIKDLLSEDSVDNLTRLVLVNALYFKGTWKNKFNPENTIEQPFHINANSTVQVPMMYKEDDYAYGFIEELDAQLLEISYVGDEASMLIVLPQEIEGLNGVLQKLADGYDLMSQVEKLTKTKVQVSLPKFKIETEIDLQEVLPKLGINAIFRQSKSGITKLIDTEEELYVSKAVQKAFIEVNEEGAEAAAATVGVVRSRRSMPNVFSVDRPALWCIRIGGHVVFMSIYRPAAQQASRRDEL